MSLNAPVEVDGDDPVPHRVGRLVNGGEVVVDPCDVGQSVDGRLPGRNDPVDVVLVRDVAGDGNDITVRHRRHEVVQAVARDVDRDDPAALAGDAGCGRPADPGCCAGHDHRLAGEAIWRDPLLPADVLLGVLRHHAAVGLQHQVIDHRLGQLSLTHGHQPLQRQIRVPERACSRRTRPAPGAPGSAGLLGVLQPGADRTVRRQRFRLRRHAHLPPPRAREPVFWPPGGHHVTSRSSSGRLESPEPVGRHGVLPRIGGSWLR